MEDLANRYKLADSNKVRSRIKCAILRKKGKSIPFIASILKKRESTISDILRRFEERGVSACHPKKRKGRPTNLSEEELLLLRDVLTKSPVEQNIPCFFWTTKLVAYFIKIKFNTNYSTRHVYRIMKSFEMSIYNHTSRVNFPCTSNKQSIIKISPELKKILYRDKRSPYWIFEVERE